VLVKPLSLSSFEKIKEEKRLATSGDGPRMGENRSRGKGGKLISKRATSRRLSGWKLREEAARAPRGRSYRRLRCIDSTNKR